MLFNSFSFFFFFLAFCLIYFLLKKQLRLFVILLASIFFYYCFSLQGTFILAATIIFNYYTGIFIERWEKKERILILSIVVNVGSLFLFKYYDFFDSSLTDVLHTTGITNPFPLLHLLIPAGISFFTLQAIGYNVDVYTEVQEAEKNLSVFAAYFFFFPKIAQGPVERPRNLLPQLHRINNVSYIEISNGVKLAAWGLFKKVVIADRLSLLVDQTYTYPHSFNGLALLIAGLFYTFQLYADFSGYTDIAIGISEIMGFKLMKNFNHPFASTSVTDFWKRWHISFSTWLYEYIYNPLSLSKRSWGKWGMVFAIMVTFILSGLWHGVGWTFVLWGAVNGVALAYELLTVKARRNFWKRFSPTAARYLSIAITFSFTVMSFTFARANSVADGIYIIRHSISGLKESIYQAFHRTLNLHEGIPQFDFWVGLICIVMLFSIHLLQDKFNPWKWVMSKPVIIRWSVYYIIMLGILWLGVYDNKKFIYFQF